MSTNPDYDYGSDLISQDALGSYETRIGPPFKPIRVRDIYDQPIPTDTDRLSDDDLRQLLNEPIIPDHSRLVELSREANNELHTERLSKFGPKRIIQNIVETLHLILNDIIAYEWKAKFPIGILDIFTKDKRLIYFSIFTILMTIWIAILYNMV